MSTRKSKPSSFFAKVQTSTMRSASASTSETSPRNSAGSESKSPNLARSWLASSRAVTVISDSRFEISDRRFLAGQRRAGSLQRCQQGFAHDFALQLDQGV